MQAKKIKNKKKISASRVGERVKGSERESGNEDIGSVFYWSTGSGWGGELMFMDKW